MSSKVNMLNASGQTKFSKAPLAGLEFSKMLSKPKRYVPIMQVTWFLSFVWKYFRIAISV